MAVIGAAWPASALQPLAAFVASARTANLDAREAQATVDQRANEERQAAWKLGPNVTVRGTYTRNQYNAVFPEPVYSARGRQVGTEDLTILPYNQVDGYFTLTVPLVDVGAWDRLGAAGVTLGAARARAGATALEVEKAVTRAYFQVVASEAVLTAARSALATAKESDAVVETRRAAGTASDLDSERARAEVERQAQVVATANQVCLVARRSLQSLTGLTPSEASVPLPNDPLVEEPTLLTLEAKLSELPSVRAAELDTEVAARNESSAWAALYPTLSASAIEHLTNATSFTGQVATYQIVGTATWTLDPSSVFAARAQGAIKEATKVRELRAKLNARDDLHAAFQEVRAQLAKARAAEAEAKASARAAQLAQERYLAGSATTLDVQQAQRDALNSEVARIQAHADLAYARALIRLDSGRPAADASR
jgi:outer membrane protein TolC